MSVRDSLKALVDKKLSKFERIFGDDAEITVKCGYVHDLKRLEITISANGTLFRCEEEASTFENALDECVESIERQIRKNKTRLEKRLRAGALDPKNFETATEPLPEDDNNVIRTKTFRVKPMTPDDAILQMNLLGHTFFVFRNSETDSTCVVYKRNDGDYGLIVPEE